MSKIEFVDFVDVQQSWDKYRLPDGSTLSGFSLLLMPIKETHDNGDVEYRLRTANHYVISKNGMLLGIDKGRQSKENVMGSLTGEPIKPSYTLRSSENIYKLNDGTTAFIKTDVESIQKTKLFSDAIPVYYIKTKNMDRFE